MPKVLNLRVSDQGFRVQGSGSHDLARVWKGFQRCSCHTRTALHPQRQVLLVPWCVMLRVGRLGQAQGQDLDTLSGGR